MQTFNAEVPLGGFKMSDRIFMRFGKLITAELGIKMPLSKKALLEGRLQKRLRALGMKSFEAYDDYIFTTMGKENELLNMLDLVTTNKTDFFREPRQFDYLLQTVLPKLLHQWDRKNYRELRIWSAGCSTGAEPYTLAMLLSEFIEKLSGIDFFVLATDICNAALDKAKRAVYGEDEVKPVPFELKKKYLLKSKNRRARQVRVIPELRAKVEFRRINFMDAEFGIRSPLDIIFCRNVIIYFDRSTQEVVLNKICRYLRSGGYLFMGHSETLHGIRLPLDQAATTIYKRR